MRGIKKNDFLGWYPENPVEKEEFIKYFRRRNLIIVRLKIAGWSNSQIGELVGLSKASVKDIYFRKMRRARKKYQMKLGF